MAHLVKCLYCGETFDADKEPFIKPRANRYAHEKCANGATAQQAAAANDIKKGLVVDSEKEAYNELKDYLNTLFKGKINWPLAISKMQALRLQNYTYSGMRKALQWWYEIKKNSPQDVKSPLGIIPYIYEDAYKYYEAIFSVYSLFNGGQVLEFIDGIINVMLHNLIPIILKHCQKMILMRF